MGKLIVIDGLDGCGKATQTDRLLNRLRAEGKNAHKASFPNYESESSSAVKVYLGGGLGEDPSKLNPYMCSIFYMVDRAIQFNNYLNSIYNNADAILICDRYLSANIIHQGGKIVTAEEQRKFFEWEYDTEVGKLGLPLEVVTIILSLPVDTSQNLMLKRYDNHEEKKDIHEADTKYLRQCYDTVDKAVEHLNNLGYNWVKIDCSDGEGGVRTLQSIENDIWKVVEDLI